MKKYKRIKMPLWLMLVGLVFATGVLGVSAITVRQAAAEEMVVDEDGKVEMMDKEQIDGEEEKLETTVEVEAEEVDYYLPYPGLLPDHPLYWLKMARDRIQLWLTTDRLAKVERLLLYADKRLGAGWALIDGNKKELGITTLTKAEKYLERAVAESKKLGENDKEISFKERLEKASKKHGQVLELLLKKVDGEQKEVLKETLKLSQEVKEVSKDTNVPDGMEVEELEKEDLDSQEKVEEVVEKEEQGIDNEIDELLEDSASGEEQD